MLGRMVRGSPAARGLAGGAAALLLAVLARAALAAAPGPELPPAPPGAVGATAFDAGEPRVQVRLLADADFVAPGEPFRIGALFQLAPGWHLYWKNPGDTGAPTELAFESRGLALGPLQWPAPRAFVFDGGFAVDYGYEGEVLLWHEARIEPDAAAPQGAMQPLRAELRFLVCRLECVPGELALALPLAVGAPGDAAAPAADAIRARFERFEALRPEPAAAFGASLRVQRTRERLRPGDRFGISIELEGCPEEGRDCSTFSAGSEDPRELFLPERVPQIRLRAVALEALGEGRSGLRVQLEGEASADPPAGDAALRAVLALRDARGRLRHIEIEAPLPRGPRLEPAPAASAPAAPGAGPAAANSSGVGLLAALALGWLGGLILNLMPCVLPVLAIKLFSLVEGAGRTRAEALRHAAAYAAGVVASLLALAGLVLALRAAGTAVGWGFQFQEPRYVAALAALCFLLALDFFGVYAFGSAPAPLARLGQRASGPARSLFEGLLVVVLATPCSAPFLGTALGFAFAGSAAQVLGVFAAIGVGLATPFCAAALLPALRRWVPRPGPWLRALRAALGLCLVATSLWLLSLLYGGAGGEAVAAVLGQLALLGIAAAGLGSLQRARRAGAARAAAVGVLALLAAGPLLLPVAEPPLLHAAAPSGARAAAEAGGAGARRSFSPEAVADALEQGRPAFVIFTADWCITCKLNERAVLADARVADELAQQGYAVFVADWTRRDETIRAELARHGRAGIPLYLVYDPRRPDEPERLSELITVEGLVRALRAATSTG